MVLNGPCIPLYVPTRKTRAPADGTTKAAIARAAISTTLRIPSPLYRSWLSGQLAILHVRIELEGYSRYLHVVAGLKTLRLERGDHPDPSQSPLQVRHCLLVVEVVAGDQALDAPARHPVGAVPHTLNTICPAGRGPENPVLGQLL